MKNSCLSISLVLLAAICLYGFSSRDISLNKTGTVKITFVNTVKGNAIDLGNTVYTNPFSETYTITRFKYYISNVNVASAGTRIAEEESYHLIDEAKPESLSFSFNVKADTYNILSFLLGVDSLKNVSGAQTGALDPLNDMFWTWNSGYIMAKMEGRSPQSKLVNNKVEFHIGGFSGEYSALKYLRFKLPAALQVSEGKTSEIIIEADFDKWWQDPNELKIAEHPVCSVPGPQAKQFADNYSKMFTIKEVINN